MLYPFMTSSLLCSVSCFCFIVVNVISYPQGAIGKQSVKSKRRKRKLQKARKRKQFSQRKKFSQPTEEMPTISTDSCFPSEVSKAHSDKSIEPVNKVCYSSMAYGEDLIALEMRLEDSLKPEDETYSYEYLMECRQRLRAQVEQYKSEVERLSGALTKQSAEHRQQLDAVRNFYQTIAYSRCRSGAMVKKSLVNSSPAAELMKQLDGQYGSHSDM